MKRPALGEIARLVILAACLVYVFWGSDPVQLLAAVGRYGAGFMILGVAGTAFALLPMSWRFCYLLQGEIRFRDALLVVLLGIGINNFLPAKAGEFAKVAYLRTRTGKSLACGANLVFWERFFDIQAIILLGLFSSLFIQQKLVTVPLLIAALSAWGIVFLLQARPALAFRLTELIPYHFLRLFLNEAFGHFARRVNLAFLSGLALHTALTWLAYIFYYYLVLNVGAGFALEWRQVVTVVAVTSVGLALPASPGGLGLLEASLVICLGWFGIARDPAIATALVIRLTQYFPTIVASLVILANSGIGIRELVFGPTKGTRSKDLES